MNWVIDVATGKGIAGWEAPSGNDSFCVSFDSNNERLAAGSKHQFVSAYNVADRKVLLSKPVHKGFVTSVSWEPNGNRIASGSNDGTISISDVTGSKPEEVLSGHQGNVHAVAWVIVPVGTEQRKILFSCASDGTLRAWLGANTKRELLAHRLGWISQARWNRDGHSIAVSTFNDNPMWRLRIFDSRTKERSIVPVSQAMPFDVAWSPLGESVAVGQMHVDGVSIIDLEGNTLAQFHHKRAWRIAWHPDGRHLAVGSREGVAVFDTQKNGPSPVTTIPRSGGRVAWNRDGRRLAIGTYEGAVEVWDGLNGPLLATLRAAPPPIPGEIYVENEPLRKVSDVGWDPVGDRLAFVTENTVAQVIDAHTGIVQQQFFGHTGGIKCLAWSPNGKRIATGGADGTVRLYSVETGDEVSQIPHGTGSNEISSLDWSPDGESLVSAGFDGYVMVWDAHRGHDLAATKVMLKRLEEESNDKELLVHAVRLCAKTGSASSARALVERLQSLDAASREATALSDEVEITLASLMTAE